MNFYRVYYKRQYLDLDGEWKDTEYTHVRIIVIANNIEDAKNKIEECLKRAEGNKFHREYRAVQNSEIKECIGLCLYDDYVRAILR